MRIIVATHNKGKMAEFAVILKDTGIEFVSWDEAGLGDLEIEENGSNCEENSFIKADTICRITGEAAMADDSGLFVDALGGDPGVNTARYAGDHGNDAANRALLLKNLEGVPMEKRTARFMTVITVVYPDGKKLVATGICPGYISTEERGERGFGYDSVFIPEGNDKTFAELPLEYKNSISHRHLALEKLLKII